MVEDEGATPLVLTPLVLFWDNKCVTSVTLGTDGFGLSDTRKQLRHHFEVDAKYIVLAALQGLADEGKFDNSVLKDAMKRYRIDPEKIDPATRVDYL